MRREAGLLKAKAVSSMRRTVTTFNGLDDDCRQSDLAEKVGLTGPKSTALRRHVGIDDDEDCVHVFQFDSQKHYRYSDNAFRRMEEALEKVDIDAVWAEHRPRPQHPARHSLRCPSIFSRGEQL